jgi:hypothetical protein
VTGEDMSVSRDPVSSSNLSDVGMTNIHMHSSQSLASASNSASQIPPAGSFFLGAGFYSPLPAGLATNVPFATASRNQLHPGQAFAGALPSQASQSSFHQLYPHHGQRAVIDPWHRPVPAGSSTPGVISPPPVDGASASHQVPMTHSAPSSRATSPSSESVSILRQRRSAAIRYYAKWAYLRLCKSGAHFAPVPGDFHYLGDVHDAMRSVLKDERELLVVKRRRRKSVLDSAETCSGLSSRDDPAVSNPTSGGSWPRSLEEFDALFGVPFELSFKEIVEACHRGMSRDRDRAGNDGFLDADGEFTVLTPDGRGPANWLFKWSQSVADTNMYMTDGLHRLQTSSPTSHLPHPGRHQSLSSNFQTSPLNSNLISDGNLQRSTDGPPNLGCLRGLTSLPLAGSNALGHLPPHPPGLHTSSIGLGMLPSTSLLYPGMMGSLPANVSAMPELHQQLHHHHRTMNSGSMASSTPVGSAHFDSPPTASSGQRGNGHPSGPSW